MNTAYQLVTGSVFGIGTRVDASSAVLYLGITFSRGSSLKKIDVDTV